MRALDLKGQTFGRLTVIGFAESVNGKRRWDCICKCGNRHVVSTSNLRSGQVASCGCLNIEVCTKHGLAGTPFYKCWQNMLSRCFNPSVPEYERYGARGITVCDRWLKFENFRDDMFASWNPNLKIERKDNDVGYEPSNCVWADNFVQQNNTSKNIKATRAGVTKSLSEWSRITGISRGTMGKRIWLGWTPEEAAFTPVSG